MRVKIQHIKDALQAGAYQAALALALTLPDICAKVENKMSETTRTHYIAWVDNNVDFSKLSAGASTREAEMNGTLIYSLRCAFLHCGNDEIKNQSAGQSLPHTQFEVVAPGSLGNGIYYSYHLSGSTKCNRTVKAQVDAEAICKLLYESAEKYYNAHVPQLDFDPYIL